MWEALARRVSNTAATVRFSAGVSLAGSVHENFRWGTSMVGNVQEAGPMVTVDGGASAPKSEPEIVTRMPPLVGRCVLMESRDGTL